MTSVLKKSPQQQEVRTNHKGREVLRREDGNCRRNPPLSDLSRRRRLRSVLAVC